MSAAGVVACWALVGLLTVVCVVGFIDLIRHSWGPW